jgi:hypothetical protein
MVLKNESRNFYIYINSKYHIKLRLSFITLLLFNFILLAVVLLLDTELYAADKAGIGPIKNTVEKRDSFSFIVWGHPRVGRGKPPLHFEEILDRISELDVDFVVVTGDVIAGTYKNVAIDKDSINSQWEMFDERLKSLGIPVYRVPGNHDVSNFITRDVYLERYTRPPFALTYKGSRLIFLDTIGIDQQTQDGSPNWKPQELPFDDAQLRFIRNEIKKQDSYNHIFFFMHHVQRWREPSGLWWRNVHPMLKGGKTRAVFSGTPGNPGYKYDHIEEDNIHYINSCTFQALSIRWYKLKKYRNQVIEPFHRQPDNLQLVRVDGDKYTIRTIVVGEWNTPTLSSRFWLKVEQPLDRIGRRERLRHLFHEVFKPFRRLSLSHLIWGLGGLLAGALIVSFWKRRRLRR